MEKYKNIGIVGFGREGKAVYEYFKDTVASFNIFDMKSIDESGLNMQNINIYTGNDYKYKILENIDNLDVIFRGPGTPLWDIEDKIPQEKLQTVSNYFFQYCKANDIKIIGVTGTKGKGTTATLIYEILKADRRDAYLLGNIGEPALETIPKLKNDTIVVYEMSSFQLYDIKSSPDIAVCLLITEDHLDWHKDINQYREAKNNIFRFQKENDKAVYYADNIYSRKFGLNSPAKNKISYGKSFNNTVNIIDDYFTYNGHKIINKNYVKLPGKHNEQNILAAIGATYDIVRTDSIIEVLRSFSGLPYHIENIGTFNDITFFNDSFSVNPTSTIVAIESMTGPTTLIVGGVDRNIDVNPLIQSFESNKIEKIIIYGAIANRLFSEIRAKSIQAKIIKVIKSCNLTNEEYFKAVFNSALSVTDKGHNILFSPSAASFDMFTNYIKRGEDFNKLFTNLKSSIKY